MRRTFEHLMADRYVEPEAVIQLAGQSSPVMERIQEALKETDKTIADMVWRGPALGRFWKHLSGVTVPMPYEARLGNYRMQLWATIQMYGVYGQNESEMQDTFAEAAYLAFSNPEFEIDQL